MEPNTLLAKRLLKQAGSCAYLGSPLYARLLEEAAADAERGGVVAEIMEPLSDAPPGTAIALRMMGSVHRVVLEGRIPELAEFYPSVGGDRAPEGAGPVFLSALRDHADEIAPFLKRPVQTNEVGRSGALLGGFLEVARTNARQRVLEIGASAGLNLRWDRYRYEHGGSGWGDPSARVRMASFESAPDLSIEATVVERAGCDPDPIDPTTKEGRLTLASYVWPDQEARWRALQGALDVASQLPVEIERSGAADWLERELTTPSPGVATIVFHSIMWQYMTEAEQSRVEELLADFGSSASADTPLAWLRMEPPPEDDDDLLAHVHLTQWPGGKTRLVARAGYHGSPVIWFA